MTGNQLSRRRPCECGSGKRFKNCCGKKGKIPPLVVRGEDGAFQGMLRIEKVSATHFEAVQSQVPEWLFLHAAHFAEEATKKASNSSTMMTIILAAAASEALVNRLLGPLEDQKTWLADEKRLQPLEKWKHLGVRLDLKDELSLGRPPLQRLAEVQRLRNELSHFKHERHSSSVTRPVPTTFANGRLVLDMANAGPPAESRGDGPDLEAALSPARAWSYFDALADTLELVLSRYQEDPFHIVERLREVIAQARAGRAAGS